MNTQSIRLEAAARGVSGSIDTTAGVIYGVSVITEGEAKGHGLKIDSTTLSQVKATAANFAGGLKVKMNHSGGAGDIIGFLKNFRIAGKKLVADLHLLKASPHRQYVLEIAESIPDTFGLSIAFSGVPESVSGTRFARCSEIYSADLVSEPAANPTGLFSAKSGQTFEEICAQKYAETGSKAKAVQFAVDHHPAAHQEYLSRGAPHLTFAKSVQTSTTFESLVAEKAAELRRRREDSPVGKAISYVVEAYPEIHAKYLSRIRSGERIELHRL